MAANGHDTTERDSRGRFLTAGKGGPGRPRGSRNKLTTEFCDALLETFQAHGKMALERCAIQEPTQFCRLIATIMPKELDAVLSVDPELSALVSEAASFAQAFRQLTAIVGSELEPPMIEAEAEPVTEE